MQFIYNLSQQNKIYLNNLTIQENENKHFSMAKDTNKKTDIFSFYLSKFIIIRLLFLLIE